MMKTTRVHWMSAAIAAALLLTLAAPVAAQSTDPPPRVSIAAGAGIANPFNGDFDYNARTWEADVRIAMSDRVLFEATVSEWRHVGRRAIDNLQTTGGVVGRFVETNTQIGRAVGVNALVTGASGRVRFTAGGGAGFLELRRDTQQESTDCTGSARCGAFTSTGGGWTGAGQATAGVDVRIVGGLSGYGQARLVIPLTDPAYMDFRFTVGARFGFGG